MLPQGHHISYECGFPNQNMYCFRAGKHFLLKHFQTQRAQSGRTPLQIENFFRKNPFSAAEV